jgi:hypothetical protein
MAKKEETEGKIESSDGQTRYEKGSPAEKQLQEEAKASRFTLEMDLSSMGVGSERVRNAAVAESLRRVADAIAAGESEGDAHNPGGLPVGKFQVK